MASTNRLTSTDLIDGVTRGDVMQDAFLSVLEAIQHGRLDSPQALATFTRTIVWRHVCHRIGELVAARKSFPVDVLDVDHDSVNRVIAAQIILLRAAAADGSHKCRPDVILENKCQAEILARCLAKLRSKDRQVLERFYFAGQSQREICSSMRWTETQFRLNKTRAKAKLTALVEKAQNPKRPIHAPTAI